MERRVYSRMTERELIGRRMRTRVELANGYVRVPKGRVLKIIGKRSGSRSNRACRKCGVSVFIKKVEPHAVDLLPERVR